MNSQKLQYYMHDERDVLRFELAGSLCGAGLESVYQAWNTALSIIGHRRLIIDITFVVDADEHGCAVLYDWHRSGARIIAASPKSHALAEAVLGKSFLDEPNVVAHSKQSWLERLRGFVLGCPTVGPQAPVRRHTRRSSQISQPAGRHFGTLGAPKNAAPVSAGEGNFGSRVLRRESL